MSLFSWVRINISHVFPVFSVFSVLFILCSSCSFPCCFGQHLFNMAFSLFGTFLSSCSKVHLWGSFKRERDLLRATLPAFHCPWLLFYQSPLHFSPWFSCVLPPFRCMLCIFIPFFRKTQLFAAKPTFPANALNASSKICERNKK